MEPVPTNDPDQDDVNFAIDSGSFEEITPKKGDRFQENRFKDEDEDDDDHSGDDDDEDDDNSQEGSEGDCFALDDEEAGTRHKKLKSMGIMLGEDFGDEYKRDNTCCRRYWYCWLCLSVALLCTVLLLEGSVEYRKHMTLLAGAGEDGDTYSASECKVYDKQTLKVLSQHFVSHANDTGTEIFCQADKLDNCTCKHPFVAAKPESHNTEWAEIETMNLGVVASYANDNQKNKKLSQPDVVLLGDSITEHWNGIDLGYGANQKNGSPWRSNKKVFDKLFNKGTSGSAKVNGVALGIAGDRIGNLLYRLQNGEAPKTFHPKIWWLLIGMNDIDDACNADTITVGNFRIIDEIRKLHPGAIIVLNSLLPRDDFGDDEDLSSSPTWPIIQEINLKLECYANTARGVEFFNATDVFIAHRQGQTVVNKQFMKDPVHPNAEGSRLWGEAIVDRVLEIKGKMHHHPHSKNNDKHHLKN